MFQIVAVICLVLFVIFTTWVIEHEQEDEWI
jgi:hypothetical protein